MAAALCEHLDEDIPIEEAIAAAAETYNLFFLIPDLQRRKRCESRWRELLGDHVICMESPDDTCAVAAALVGLTEGQLADTDALAAALAADGMSRDRVGAVVRAVSPYASLLHAGDARAARPHVSAAKPSSSWWQRLFG